MMLDVVKGCLILEAGGSGKFEGAMFWGPRRGCCVCFQILKGSRFLINVIKWLFS